MSTGLAVIDTKALVPEQVFSPGGIENLIAKVESEARTAAATLDISTPKGRKDIASLAHKVARSKTALDDMGKALVADIKAKAATIDGDRRIVRDRLDALKAEVRKPLDDFEAAEEARIKAHEAGIADFIHAAEFPTSFTTDEIACRLAVTQAMPTDNFQEFTKRAVEAKASAVANLTAALEASRTRDAERAELERLRQEAAERAASEAAEKAEREVREREERAAAQAKAEAEAKAKREAEEAERRAAVERERIAQEAREATERAEAEKWRIEKEMQIAEQRAAQAERDRLAAEQRAKEAAEKAERDRIEAARRAETERAQQQAEEAAKRERQRIEAERLAEQEATAKREADKQHRAAINRAALEALVAAGLSEGAARTAVEAIAKGNVPNVRIHY